MKKIFFIVLGIAFSFTSCEKDDICDANTPTTPQVVIEFYDISNPETLKNVTDLSIIGIDGNGTLSFTDVSKIMLPLKTMSDLTQYQFVINSSDDTLKNEDLLDFNYSRKNEYISRACGFKTLFYLDAANPILLTDAPTSDGIWIQNITITNSNIINEIETHVKIYF
ncbi:MAG: DUF6452 family protein [Flavobacterium sp.]